LTGDTDQSTSEPEPASPFHELSSFVALPRVQELVLSADDERVVIAVSSLDKDRSEYATSLWELDPDDSRPARRITRSAEGEGAPAFLGDGSLLFASKRPDPQGHSSGSDGKDDEVPALWLLPRQGGEPSLLATRPGGITAVRTADHPDLVIVLSPTFPGASDAAIDAERRKARRDKKVQAILHESMPIRYWDHDLGPSEQHLFAGQPGPQTDSDHSQATITLRDLTPDAGGALTNAEMALSRDGSTLVSTWLASLDGAKTRTQLVSIDVASGDRKVIAASPSGDVDYYAPSFSPDGTKVVCLRQLLGTRSQPTSVTLWLMDLTTGSQQPLADDADLWPTEAVFSHDGTSVLVCADHLGHRPIFRVDLHDGAISRLTGSGAYANLHPSRDGKWLYALSSSIAHPPRPVRVELADPDKGAQPLTSPGVPASVPGRVEEVSARAEDGTALRAWLVLPESASTERPAPLLVWMHGGPVSSSNDWSWRWNAQLMVARGWAVLLPDPALSTGYGLSFVARGWGQWGGSPYTDVMALTEAALRRSDLDSERTAAMGGSYGGYLANWVAGHTTRFKAIVTHASLWALDHFQATTDFPDYWEAEWGLPSDFPDDYRAWSPNSFLSAITTPMLVIHGARDFRVPLDQALRLWWDLLRHNKSAKFLYFPDENHWILKPNNAVVWYETVFAFLDHHVLGEAWRRPELL
jgi:dipeptidyl aminopeptidase/acylaminoacyl peptidase